MFVAKCCPQGQSRSLCYKSTLGVKLLSPYMAERQKTFQVLFVVFKTAAEGPWRAIRVSSAWKWQ